METALVLSSGRPTLRRKRPEQEGDSERNAGSPLRPHPCSAP